MEYKSLPSVLSNPTQLDYQKTDNALEDIQYIVETSQKVAYTTVDIVLLRRNWLIGKRISEEKLNGEQKDRYGFDVINKLSKGLTKRFGRGYSSNALYSYVRFYKDYPDIFYSASKKSAFLSWTHYRTLLQVNDATARKWYENEAINQGWSVRTLQRNISSQYYYRKLNSSTPELVEKEMINLTSEYQDKAEIENQKTMFYLQHSDN